MPALTWDQEDLEYIIWAYRYKVHLDVMVEILGRDKFAISNCAGRLGLTDKANVQRVRYEKGIAKITPEVIAIIEELILDWGYSAHKIRTVLNTEYGVAVSRTSIRQAIYKRVSREARKQYKIKWSKHSKYKALGKRKWLKKGPKYEKQAIEKYLKQQQKVST